MADDMCKRQGALGGCSTLLPVGTSDSALCTNQLARCCAVVCAVLCRGHMWDSGYVVVPTSAGCCVSVTLQVDPKVRAVAHTQVCKPWNSNICVRQQLPNPRCSAMQQQRLTVCSTESDNQGCMCHQRSLQRAALMCVCGCVLMYVCLSFFARCPAGMDPHKRHQLVSGGHPPQHSACEGGSGAPGPSNAGTAAREQHAAGSSLQQATNTRPAGQTACGLDCS